VSETPRTDALKHDISVERYGKPLVAALDICLELERELERVKVLLREIANDLTSNSELKRRIERELGLDK
jgi:hypothetical protein